MSGENLDRWEKCIESKRKEIDRIKDLQKILKTLEEREYTMKRLSDNDIRIFNLNNGTLFEPLFFIADGYYSCRNDPVYKKIDETLSGCDDLKYPYSGATLTYLIETHFYIIKKLHNLKDKIVRRRMKQEEYQKLAASSHSEIVDGILNDRMLKSDLVNAR